VGPQLVPGAHVVSPRGEVSEHGALRFFRRTGEGVYDMEDLARRTATVGEFVAEEVARTGASESWAWATRTGRTSWLR
jgi:phospholipase/carboxylesterase